MADPQGADVDIRPSKRARLDDSAVPTPTPPISNTPQATPASIPITPIPADTAAIDNDLQREIRAGIVEYVCPSNLGFTGILKQRYTDFMVNEIGVDGKVLHLTSAELRGKDGRRENMNEKQNGKEKEEEKTQENKQEGESDHKMKDVAGAEQKEDAKASEISENDALNAPKLTEEPEVKEEKEEELAEEDLATLHEIFGEETTTQILSLVRSIRKKEHRKAKDFKAVIAPPIKDKEVRTRAHQSLRRIFPNLLESGMERDQSIRIKAVPLAERKGGQKNGGRERNRDRARNRDRDPDPERHRGQLAWEELGGEYLHFSLYKENKDTMEVIGFLGSKLGGGSKAFSFAGTKDRRACTVQRVCVKRQTAERMSNFNRVLFNAAVGNFEYRSNDLGLGDLKGNEFTITLRDCHFQGEEGMNLVQRQQLGNEVVGKAIKDFSEKGFINYYGLQRFGSFSASTDTIGLKMLQEDLRGAVDDLLTYSEVALAAAEGTNTDSNILISQDDRNRAKALHLWKTTGKGSAALDILPRKFTAERNIIQHLSSRNSKSGKYDRKSDWQGALMTIPRSLRLMYVHAYQSLVWNVVAGKRWTTYGTRVVEGDLILVSEHRDKEDKPAVKETVAQDQDGEFVINPSGTEDANADALDFERARALTAAEAASGKYTIWDIVLPQPGFDVEYPKNDIGKFYEEFMGSEKGGELDPHRMRRGWREISLSGGYRKFLARPLTALEYEVRQYVRDVDQFIETDLQKLRREQGVEVDSGAKAPILLDAGAEVDGREEDKKLAVVIKMQLASSQYATVALRELTKADGVKAFKPEFMGGR